jgi:hypothetical protein
MEDKLMIVLLVLAAIGLFTVLAKLWKLMKMMQTAKEGYEAALKELEAYEPQFIEEYQAMYIEQYGPLDFLKELPNKAKDAFMSVIDTVLKPFKAIYRFIRKQLYEIVPFLVFQLLIIGFLIYWAVIPPHKNLAKVTVTTTLIVVLLTGVIGISYATWSIFKWTDHLEGKDETYLGYLLRKEISFFKAIATMTKKIFDALVYGKKKKESYAEMFSTCFV